MHDLDDIDRRILRALQRNATASAAEIAEQVGLSTTPCWRRISRMEREGVIRGRAISVDLRKLGFDVEVYLRVRVDKTAYGAFDEFLAAAKEVPEVLSIQTLLGRVDVRMDVVARDLQHYQTILKERIMTLPHVADIEALMLVSEVKNDEAMSI
ncbi:MAG: Lrp/AsnC family transcriptional regulator [Pseudomonadota bacterium]